MAKTRGNMKRPYRIRRDQKKEGGNYQFEDELGDDIQKPTKKPQPIDIMKRRDRTKGVDAQRQKYLEKALKEKQQMQQKTTNEQIYETNQNVNIWQNCTQQVALPAKTRQAISSALSYNPDKLLLEAAQKQAAQIYLDQDIKHLKFKLEQIQTRVNSNLLSDDAFLQLNGEQTIQRVDEVQHNNQIMLENELQKLQQIKEQIQQQKMQIDEYELLKQQFAQRKQNLQAEYNELEQMKKTHYEKVNQETAKSLDRRRAESFEEFVLDIEAEKQVISQLINLYNEEFPVQMMNYNIPLQHEIKGCLRQTKIYTHIEDQFKKMKREGQFDEENQEIPFENIKKVKTIIKVRKDKE